MKLSFHYANCVVGGAIKLNDTLIAANLILKLQQEKQTSKLNINV